MKEVIVNIMSVSLNLMAFVVPKQAGKVGFRLFCRPFRIKMNARHLNFYDSAEQSELVHKGERIKVLRWGRGEKSILFLHGWQSFSYHWKAYIREFDPEEYSLYAFDAPGHGLSTGSFLSVPLYSEVVEKMIINIGNVEAIIAHSLGGFTALYTLSQRPDHQAKKLVLLSPPGEANEFFTFYQESLKLSDTFITLTRERFKEIFNKSPEDFSAPEFANSLTIPGLIIHDEGDEETSCQNSVNINNSWAGSKLVITKGMGHNLKSKEVVKQVVDFIEE